MLPNHPGTVPLLKGVEAEAVAWSAEQVQQLSTVLRSENTTNTFRMVVNPSIAELLTRGLIRALIVRPASPDSSLLPLSG